MRTLLCLASLLALVACGRSRVVSPPPPSDGGPLRDAPDGEFRYAVLRPDCGPADGPAWSALVARVPLDCDDFTRTDEHIRLYFLGEPYGTEEGGNVSYCPGGLAPCETSSESEVQVSPRGTELRLRAVFPSLVVDGTLEATICDDGTILCG